MKPRKQGDRIELMRKRLYSRGGSVSGITRHRLRDRSPDARRSWEENTVQGNSMLAKGVAQGERHKKTLVFFVIFSIIFFVAAVGFSVFYFLQGSNLISTDNVDIIIEGPTAIAGGEELKLEIEIVNRNSIPLELADMIVEFPDGTRSATDVTKALPRYRESLGTVPSGERVRKNVNAVLFGAENTPIDITVTVEWRAENSNAIFYTEKTYELTLSSSPLGVAVRSEEEAVSGQEMSFLVTIVSNSDARIEEAALAAEFPFGFSFSSSDPSAASSGIWHLGDIDPGEEKVVRIRGIMAGQENDERTFRFKVGVLSEKNDAVLGAAFSESVVPVVIRSPFLATTFALNGSTDSTLAIPYGEQARVDLTWENTTGGRITNAIIEARLSGSSLNPASVNVDQGFYQSANNTIVWDQRTNSELGSISEGGKGRVSFSFSSFGGQGGSSFKNPEIAIDVSVRGIRVDEEGVPEEVESSISRTVRVSSFSALSAATLHSSGPFTNTGPVPPRANIETTYTVKLSLTNFNNSLSDVRVIGTLPAYIRWIGAISPSGERVVYSPVGGAVSWNIGDLPAGVGVDLPVREVYFKVALTPSVSQIGSTPNIISNLRMTGIDRYSKAEISADAGTITTELKTEGAQVGEGAVQE